MDGFDVVSRQPAGRLRDEHGVLMPLSKFIEASKKLGLPLNVSKRVVQCYNGSLLGGALDGEQGVFRH